MDQIDNLLIENYIEQLVPRVVDLSQLPNGELLYTYEDRQLEEGETLFDIMIFNENITAPTFDQLVSEFEVFKQELKDQLLEKERIESFRERFKAIRYLNTVFSYLGKTIPDQRVEIERVISENDTASLESYESTDEIVHQDLLKKNQRDILKRRGQRSREICQSLLDLVAGNNIEKQLTSEQIDQMETTYSELLVCLQNNRPDKFKTILLTTDVDGTLVTEEDKQEYLSELSMYGL